MKIQILNSFKGDDVREIATETQQGRGTAAKMIADLLKTGSALFLERDVNGKTYTYRVIGYDEVRDKIKLQLHKDDPLPEPQEPAPRRGRGRPRGTTALAAPSSGQIVSVAPVSGGTHG